MQCSINLYATLAPGIRSDDSFLIEVAKLKERKQLKIYLIHCRICKSLCDEDIGQRPSQVFIQLWFHKKFDFLHLRHRNFSY
jgi:hypothetical protein